MGANVLCLTSSGGLPLFSRNIGKVEPLPFSLVGSLNAVFTFGKSKNVQLLNTKGGDATVVWKEFNNSLTFIAHGVLNGEDILNQLLESIYGALVFIVGQEELKTIKNVERLKREIRPCFQIIDRLIGCIDIGDRVIGTPDLLDFNECVLHLENSSILTALNAFADCVGSLFVCITIDNAIVVGTEGWWQLTPLERKLIVFLKDINNDSTAIDIPIFLPTKSPTVPFRLVCIRLVNTIWINIVCGPQPDLSTIEQISYQCWTPAVELLNEIYSIHPKNIPRSLDLHSSIYGLLLLNSESGKFISSRCTNTNRKESKSCGEVLKTFFYEAGKLLFDKGESTTKETYWCSEYHKCYAIRQSDNILCVLYSSVIPVATMRLITQETLKMLISDPKFCW